MQEASTRNPTTNLTTNATTNEARPSGNPSNPYLENLFGEINFNAEGKCRFQFSKWKRVRKVSVVKVLKDDALQVVFISLRQRCQLSMEKFCNCISKQKDCESIIFLSI